ncbi:MAG: hypothetical protein HRU40_13550 [Saprospiraceae bacterium]|nr:hypothetical protein [Saprospiraceae bacterium]
MEPKHIDEIREIVNQASVGNWIPAAVVASLMSLVVLLLLVIYKKDKKESNKRHDNLEELTQKLADLTTANQKILAVHDTEINNLKQRA